MDHRTQAEELYKFTKCNSSENSNQLTTVKEYLRHFVCKCQPSQKFKVKEIPSIIMKSVKQESFISSKASESFEKLEYYFSLVSSNPWKAEFHTIKKYSGFFQTKIASHLTGVEELFRIAGYSENPIKNEFKLKCIIIHELQIRTKFSINAADIANLRATHCGDVEEMYSVLRKSFNLKKDDCIITSPDQTIKNIDYVDQLSPRQPPMRTQHGQALSVVESDIRPEIQNSEFKEGTLEDHMMASLQLIEEEKEETSQTPKQPSVRPSDEWSFVNEGLLKKYGEKYFNGQRGNILQTPSSKESRPYRDSGIESGVPSELPYADVDTIRTRSTRVIKEKNPHSAVHAQISWPTHPEQSPLHRPQYSWPQHEPAAQPVHKPQFSSPFPQGQQQTTKAELLRARNKSVSSAFPPDQWSPKENIKPEIVEQLTADDIVGVIRPSRSITKTDFVVDTPQNPTAAPVYSRISKPVVNDKLSSPGHCQPFTFSSHSAPIALKKYNILMHDFKCKLNNYVIVCRTR
ncbi:hypothetical protein AM593_06573, partial [Mytilus galloprovincialis]